MARRDPEEMLGCGAGDLTIGPVSAATVIGIAAGICLLLLLVGLLLAMRYHRQNRDRLIDLDALVRQLTLGSEGTPGTHPSPHTPQGRIMSMTPSSMYTNAAFQASRREAEAAAMISSPREGRGASTAPGAVFSGGTSRPFGSVSGLRDSPLARRTIRPPAPGHVPLTADEFSRSQSGGGAVGEDTSATHVSAAMDGLALGSQGSLGDRVVWRSPGWSREQPAAAGAATGVTGTLDAALDTQSTPDTQDGGRGHLDTTLMALAEGGPDEGRFADVSTMRSADMRAAAVAAAAVQETAAQRAAAGRSGQSVRHAQRSGEIRAAPRGAEVEMTAVPPAGARDRKAGKAPDDWAAADPMSSQTDGEYFSIMSSYGMPEGGQPGQVWATVESADSSSLSRGLLGIGGAIQEGSEEGDPGEADQGGTVRRGGGVLSPLKKSPLATGVGGGAAAREKLWMSIESEAMAAQVLQEEAVLGATQLDEPGDEPRLEGLLADVGPSSGSATAQLCKEGFSSPLKHSMRGQTGGGDARVRVPRGQRSVSRGSLRAGRMGSVDENPWASPPLSQEDGRGNGDSPSLGNTFPSAMSGMRGDSFVGDSGAGAS